MDRTLDNLDRRVLALLDVDVGEEMAHVEVVDVEIANEAGVAFAGVAVRARGVRTNPPHALNHFAVCNHVLVQRKERPNHIGHVHTISRYHRQRVVKEREYLCITRASAVSLVAARKPDEVDQPQCVGGRGHAHLQFRAACQRLNRYSRPMLPSDGIVVEVEHPETQEPLPERRRRQLGELIVVQVELH